MADAIEDRLILALPNGRILDEVMPLLRRIGVEPEPEFEDPASRRLRFETSEPSLDLIRVRSFDVATFVAFGAAQLGVAGNDVLMEFDYSEIYAPLDLDVGHCHIAVAATAASTSPATSRFASTSRANAALKSGSRVESLTGIGRLTDRGAEAFDPATDLFRPGLQRRAVDNQPGADLGDVLDLDQSVRP